MSKHALSQFFGVICSFFVIWLINDYLLVDQCLDNGGQFKYETGECLLASKEVVQPAYGNKLIAAYFFIGIFIAYFISLLVRKLFNINKSTI